jgi:hypothetical protein
MHPAPRYYRIQRYGEIEPFSTPNIGDPVLVPGY